MQTATPALALILVACALAPSLAGQEKRPKPKPDQKTAKDSAVEKAKKADKSAAKVTKIDGYSIAVKTIKPQPIVSIRIQTKAADLSQHYGKYLPMLFGYAAQNGGEFAGMPLAIYHAFDAKGMVDVEMAAPLKKPIKGNDEIKAGTLYGGKVVTTHHLGDYHDLRKAHDAVQKWFKQNKLEAGAAPWEVYTSDPTTVKPSEVRTDLFFPIKTKTKPKAKPKAGKKPDGEPGKQRKK